MEFPNSTRSILDDAMPVGRVETALSKLPVVARVIERLDAARAENAALHRRLQRRKGAAPSLRLVPASGGARREVCTMGASRVQDIVSAMLG